ncbi:LysR family transcriptional regulator [Roseibium algae]|uniref:LysR family transcriptional regulator n=1 Tax=Roseibium algae TaxID=3123038 RepID=A0ABU8TLD4_9HYPH
MDLKRGDLSLMVSLDALLAEGSVTAASRRLGISQPALSAQLARLRTLFGDDLLVGNAHGMVLTPRAENLQAPLHKLLEGLNELIHAEADFDPRTADCVFRIAASDLAHLYVLPRLLPLLRARSPGITLDAVALDIDLLAEKMERGEIDFAVASADNTPEGFPSRRVSGYEFRYLYRKGHPLVDPALSVEAFCKLDHLAVTIKSGRLFSDLDESLRRKGLKRNIACSVPNFLLVPEIVRNSDQVAVVPSSLAELEHHGLESLPIPINVPPVIIHLSWHPRFKRDPSHKWIRDLIADEVGE